MVNLEFARQQMIGQQIRTGAVLEPSVLDALATNCREKFVPKEYAGVAFADCMIPLPHGQFMMSPLVEGQLLQSLDLSKSDKVLEIGTGSGYLTACLATLAAHVVSIDILPDLTAMAHENLAAGGRNNVTLNTMNAMDLDPQQKYDAIAVTGSLPVYDKRFESALNIGGRLFIIVGQDPIMVARLVTRVGDDEFTSDTLFQTAIPPLLGIQAPGHFRF